MPDISKDLDLLLARERIIDQANRKKGVISPSSLGQCLRRQVWTRAGEEMSDPPDAQTLRIFKEGNILHVFIQSMYPEECREVEVSDGDVYGHADLVFADEVKDIKTCGVFQFKKFVKMSKEEFAKEKTDYILQACTYAVKLSKDFFSLVLVSKDDLTILEFRYETKTHRASVEAELSSVREAWVLKDSSSVLPKAIPRLYNGKECQYCAFHNKCEILEGTKAF